MAILFNKEALKQRAIDLISCVLPFTLVSIFLPNRFILYGHLVSNKKHPVKKYYRYPSLEEFDRLLKTFTKKGYRFVDLNAFLIDNEDKKILITFDDGFKSIYEDLHPYMKRNNIPYMLFIITDTLNFPEFRLKRDCDDMGGIFLSEEEITTLKKDGVHIGFHTRSHMKIEDSYSCDDFQVSEQLCIPDKNKHLFSEPLSFAYPFMAPKNFSKFNDHMTKRCGYKFFFDTRGFRDATSNHLFRASMDVELDNSNKKWLRFVIKRQIIMSIVTKFKNNGIF